MISVKGIFVAGVVSLFILLSSSYMGKAAQQASDVGNELRCAQGLKDYLEANMTQLNIQSLSIDNDVLNVEVCTNDVKKVLKAITTYMELHWGCEGLSTFTVTITICSLDVCRVGFVGPVRDWDKPTWLYCTNIRPLLEGVVIQQP